MARYMIRRLLWACVLFIAVTIVSYVLFFIIPADPAKTACGQTCTQEDVQRVSHFLGLDRPIYVQYWKFLENLVIHQDLGTSFYSRRPVNDIVKEAAPV